MKERKPLRVKALYTLAEVARMIGRPRQTVSDWAKRGELTVTMFAGRQYVPLAAIQAHGLVWQSIQLADQVNGR